MTTYAFDLNPLKQWALPAVVPRIGAFRRRYFNLHNQSIAHTAYYFDAIHIYDIEQTIKLAHILPHRLSTSSKALFLHFFRTSAHKANKRRTASFLGLTNEKTANERLLTYHIKVISILF